MENNRKELHLKCFLIVVSGKRESFQIKKLIFPTAVSLHGVTGIFVIFYFEAGKCAVNLN